MESLCGMPGIWTPTTPDTKRRKRRKPTVQENFRGSRHVQERGGPGNFRCSGKDCCRGENGGNGSATILRRNEVQGRPRELTIRNGSAVLRTNGESFDATDILKDMRAHGVDIGRVSGKAMSEMLKGNKTALPGASGNSVFAIVKGPAGYGLKAFQIAKQVHSAAAQEI